jgi:hypothetical protein
MNCREIEPLIYLYQEGELTETEKSRVAEHLAGCPACRELSESVKAMVQLVGRIDYAGNIDLKDNKVTQTILQRTFALRKNQSVLLLKAIAACLLTMIISSITYQEYDFYKARMDLQFRVHQAEKLSSENSGISDCVQELKRKFTSRHLASFSRPDTASINLISEEALAAYIRERCGTNAEDVKTVKKLLIQAGLIKTNTLNEQKN